jgi:hypothetical protein
MMSRLLLLALIKVFINNLCFQLIFHVILILLIKGATVEALVQNLNKPPHLRFQVHDEMLQFFGGLGLYKSSMF